MKPSDLEKFRILLVGTAGTWGHYLPPESIPIWFNDLIHYDLNEIENAFEIFRKDSNVQKLPTPGQVIYTIHSLRKKPVEVINSEKQPIPEGVMEKIYAEIDAAAKTMTCKPSKNLVSDLSEEPIEEKKISGVKPLNDTDWEKIIKRNV